MGFLAGKKILITGVLSNRSIAYGVAQACRREGAELAFTYVNDELKERVVRIAAEFGAAPVLRCDVTKDDDIDALFAAVASEWGALDGLLHAIAFAPREALAGDFLSGMLGDAGRGAVRGRGFQRRDLHEIEVVEQADPHDAGQEVQPPCKCGYQIHLRYLPYIRKFLTARYRITVRTRPQTIVPQIDSSGFFIAISPCASHADWARRGILASGHRSDHRRASACGMAMTGT